MNLLEKIWLSRCQTSYENKILPVHVGRCTAIIVSMLDQMEWSGFKPWPQKGGGGGVLAVYTAGGLTELYIANPKSTLSLKFYAQKIPGINIFNPNEYKT